jgi:hypothetical protein
MALPTESRTRLADLLVETLEADEIGSIEQAGIVEAKWRRDDVRAGRVKAVPGEEALQRLRDSSR